MYWYVSLFTYVWEGWCILAAYACTKANGQPWTAARFPIGSPSYQWRRFHAARVFVCTFYALSSVINAAILSSLILPFTRLPPGSRRIRINVKFLRRLGGFHSFWLHEETVTFAPKCHEIINEVCEQGLKRSKGVASMFLKIYDWFFILLSLLSSNKACN